MADVVVTKYEKGERIPVLTMDEAMAKADAWKARNPATADWRELCALAIMELETWRAASKRYRDAYVSGRDAAEARGRAAERERCAGMVREMAAKLDEDAKRLLNSGGNPYASPSDFDRECDGKAEQCERVYVACVEALNAREGE